MISLRFIPFGLALVASLAFAQVPPQLGVVVMLKVLTYDTAFAQKGAGDFVVCVPTSDTVPNLSAAYEALEPVGSTLLSGRKVKLVPVPLDKSDALASQRAAAVLLLPGLEAKRVDQWVAAALPLKVYTLSLVPADARDKVLLSVEEVEGKPRPVLNKRLAAILGAQFPASVLKVARVVP